MSESVMPPLQYLRQVESLIGMPFFSDPAQGERLRTDPAQIELEVLRPRIAIYIAGLDLLRSEIEQPAAEQPEDAAERAAERARAIGALRGELMMIDSGLEPPNVRALRGALETMPRTPWSLQESRRPNDKLTPWQIPLQSIKSIVNISSGSALIALRHREVKLRKVNLPGVQPREICCDWDMVRDLARTHGLRPEMADKIDLDKLPHSSGDKNRARRDYARELQLEVVPPHKLRNIPELAERLPKIEYPEARPYHVTRENLAKVIGGGLHFIDGYCDEHGIGDIPRRIRGRSSVGRYMLLEEAAQVWEAYNDVPVATEEDMTLIRAAQEIEVGKVFFQDELTEDEALWVSDMRAIEPKGRILPHLPREVARIAMDRLRRGPLPPHLIPAQVLDKYFAISYSGIMHAHERIEGISVRRRLFGTHKTLSCFTWEAVRILKQEKKIAVHDLDFEIDFSRLPLHEDDLDPDHIAYAREIQALLVNHPDQVDQTPIGEWIAAQQERIRQQSLGAELINLSYTYTAASPLQRESEQEDDEREEPVVLVPPEPEPEPEPEDVVLPEPDPPSAQEPEQEPAIEPGPRHDPEVPGSWQPAVDPEFVTRIAPNDQLTAPSIASLFEISVGEVRDAVRRIDPGYRVFQQVVAGGQLEPIYEGDMLAAVCEQLAGIPLQRASQMFQLDDQQLGRARDYLASLRYGIFEGDRCSPAAFQIIRDNLARFKADERRN